MAGGGQVADQAFVTLATNDTYALGALVLAHSLRGAGTTRQIAIMVTPGVTQGIRQQLSQVFDLVQDVDVLDSRDQVNLALLTRPDLGITFTKFHCWRLTQYSKCVFLDADTLVLSNVDELFDREELSAAPDAGWPDCFNSGVFVFRPSDETYQSLLQFAVSQGSFDGGDQGLLNMYFSDWATKDIARHLPFIYNCVSQAFYSYLPAFKFYGKNVKIVHFIGSAKPWHHAFNTATGQVELSGDAGNHKQFLQRWWQLFMDNVQPNIDPGMGCVFFLKWPKLKFFMATYMKLSQAMKSWLKEKYNSNSRLNPSGLVCLQAHLIRLIWQPPAEREEIVVCPAFVPPSIQTYYEQPVADSTTLVFVESRQDRPYSFFETFYSEPPMTSGEEYPTPQGAYDAKTFEQELREFVQAEEDNHVVCSVNPVPSEPSPPPPEPKQEEAPQHFHGQIDQSHHAQREAEWKQQEEEAQQREEAQRRELEIKQFEQQLERESLQDITYNNSGAAGDTNSEHSKAPDGCSGKLTESDHSGAASAYWVGFQEGVAKIGTFSQAELGDPERRYQWERGQIDYTGIDSFDNIQKRLQQMMDSKEQAESLGPVSGEPPKPQEPAVPLTPSGKPLKPAIKQPVKLPVKLPAKSALKK